MAQFHDRHALLLPRLANGIRKRRPAIAVFFRSYMLCAVDMSQCCIVKRRKHAGIDIFNATDIVDFGVTGRRLLSARRIKLV